MLTTLSRIRLEGFRSIRSLDLKLGRTTVLIGANGAGKSNLLAFLKMIPMMESQSLRLFIARSGAAESNLHYGPKRTPVMSFRIDAEQDDGAASAYEVRLAHAAGDALVFVEESVLARKPGLKQWDTKSLGVGHVESLLRPSSKDSKLWPASMVRSWVSRMNFYHFHDTSMESPLRGHGRQEESDYLRSDGRNLAPFLYQMANSSREDDRAAFERITRILQQIAPFVKSLEPVLTEPNDPARSLVRLDWIDQDDERFGVHQLSDGTLRAIALITALAQPKERLPQFICIDEPELGLHPAAVASLAGLVRSVSGWCQVLLATQSPTLLDEFKADDVVVVENHAGESRFVPKDSVSLAAWLDEYTLSELYQRNVLGGRP
jgi:predicted ATPase